MELKVIKRAGSLLTLLQGRKARAVWKPWQTSGNESKSAACLTRQQDHEPSRSSIDASTSSSSRYPAPARCSCHRHRHRHHSDSPTLFLGFCNVTILCFFRGVRDVPVLPVLPVLFLVFLCGPPVRGRLRPPESAPVSLRHSGPSSSIFSHLKRPHRFSVKKVLLDASLPELDGWLAGWMERWMDGLLDGWVSGQAGGLVGGGMDTWTHGRMDTWTHGWRRRYCHRYTRIHTRQYLDLCVHIYMYF